MACPPEASDEARAERISLAGHDRGHRGDVIRLEGVAQAQEEPEQEMGEGKGKHAPEDTTWRTGWPEAENWGSPPGLRVSILPDRGSIRDSVLHGVPDGRKRARTPKEPLGVPDASGGPGVRTGAVPLGGSSRGGVRRDRGRVPHRGPRPGTLRGDPEASVRTARGRGTSGIGSRPLPRSRRDRRVCFRGAERGRALLWIRRRPFLRPGPDVLERCFGRDEAQALELGSIPSMFLSRDDGVAS